MMDSSQTGFNQIIDQVDFKNIDIRDLIRAIATKYNLNIFVDNNLSINLTLHLTNVKVIDFLNYIVNEHNLKMEQRGSIIKIYKPAPLPPEPKKWNVSYKNDLLSVEFYHDEIEEALKVLAKETGKTILLDQQSTGKISGMLQNVPFETGFKQLLENNGYLLEKKENIYTVKRDTYYLMQEGQDVKALAAFYLNIEDSLINMDVNEVGLNKIIQEAARRLNKNVFIYGKIDGQISARADGLTFIDMLDLIFQGSEYTYKIQKDIILIGNDKVKGITSAELVKLDYLKADKVTELVPQGMISKAELKPVIEQNGVMVIGTRNVINDVKDFIDKIDKPSPQILIETLVIDINNTKLRNISMNAGSGYKESAGSDSTKTYNHRIFPGIDVFWNSSVVNRLVDQAGNLFGISKIGKLPDDFFIKIEALEKEGVVNIRSRPQISTLNGYPADIAIGTTQYYEQTTRTPYRDPTQVIFSETQRFETVEANISLKIIPWVSGSGEITVEIHPEFKTPRNFDPDIPPTIDTRALNSTVRLKDGETIVLGGLIQNSTENSTEGIPILSSIPLIGNIFETHNYNIQKNELIIYVTPHLYYQDE
ncbi:MAG: hypothetical protein JW956_09345 [Calditrichaceae bacterium]|nr:hypothetical protein [Calditrichaceae bacterium]